jgi:hypothetical protein
VSTLPCTCDLLSSFALSVDLPQALVERDFHDYCNDSLTLPLARVRSILSSSKCLSLYVGTHARHFLFLTGWLQRELAGEIVPFPCTLDTGDHPFPVGCPNSAMTWVQSIPTSPYTASLTSLWPLGLGLHPPLTRHATVPSSLSSEGIPDLVGNRVSRCVTHFALVSLPRRVRETFVAQRRTTTGVPNA